MIIQCVKFLILFSILSSGITNALFAQEDKILHRVYFFGNLADVEDGQMFRSALKTQLSSEKADFSLILNGDLVKTKIEKENIEDLQNIFYLVDMIEDFSNGKLILVPGDRDWNIGTMEKGVGKVVLFN